MGRLAQAAREARQRLNDEVMRLRGDQQFAKAFTLLYELFRACSNCGTLFGRMWPSYTQYHWDGRGEDPNRDVRLCQPCGEEHAEYWSDMWREHYYG